MEFVLIVSGIFMVSLFFAFILDFTISRSKKLEDFVIKMF